MTGEVAAADGTSENHHEEKPWHSYISEDLPRTVQESADSAVRSARSLQQNSSTQIRTLQILPHVRAPLHLNDTALTIFHSGLDGIATYTNRRLFPIIFLNMIKSCSLSFSPIISDRKLGKDHVLRYTAMYRSYEDLVFNKIKDQITIAREHSTLSAGIAITAGLLLMRGPRRFLFRRTLGRFQSEETQITKAANNVNHLAISVQLMRKESEKLLERAALAEKEMTYGYGELRNTGGQIKSLAKSVHKAETQANDLVDDLREIPGREALRLRAEVANMASSLKDKRLAMSKRIMKISELGVRV